MGRINGPNGRQYWRERTRRSNIDCVAGSRHDRGEPRPGETPGRSTNGPPAVKSNRALPANAAAYSRLEGKVRRRVRRRQQERRSPITPMAASISGAVYEFPVNPSRLDSLSLKFPKAVKRRWIVKYYGSLLSFPVGLDGIYRSSQTARFNMIAGATGKVDWGQRVSARREFCREHQSLHLGH